MLDCKLKIENVIKEGTGFNMYLWSVIPFKFIKYILYDEALLGINFMKRKIYLINFDQDLDCQLSRGAVTAD